jgi:predicted small secreted protein
MSLFSKVSMIKKLSLVALMGIVVSACSSTIEGMGKDLQNMGNSMGGTNSPTTTNNQSQTTGKDVVVTPVK